ncbi:unnamed protein product, partial [Prorocentrum cordatum]
PEERAPERTAAPPPAAPAGGLERALVRGAQGLLFLAPAQQPDLLGAAPRGRRGRRPGGRAGGGA